MIFRDGCRRWLTRAGFAFGGMLLTAAIGEVVVRVMRLDGYARPELQDASGNLLGDLSRITTFFGREGERPPGSMTQGAPGALVYGWYDRPRWKYFDRNGCVEYRVNSLGFRDREFPKEKPAGELRVLAIGDSFTFGAGVQLDDCWVQLLERRLAEMRGAPV